jgi:anti-sigma regulatory factor (Ser/Thr protein kinase)
VAAIKTHGHGPGEPGVLAARAAPVSDAGCRWLMVAAERAGLAGNNFQPSPDPALRSGRLPRVATRTPGTGTGSVRAAREYVLAMLQRWDVAERREDIAIVISELLTNALRHGLPPRGHTRPQRPIRIGLLQPGPCVLCAVTDPSKAAPVPQAPGPLAETGRGLHIVCTLSDRWGYTTLSDTGKVVWATFTSRLAPALGDPVTRDL